MLLNKLVQIVLSLF